MVSSAMDAGSRSPWKAPGTVESFAQSAPNAVLMRYAAGELAGSRNARLLDIGCGAARNALPLAEIGWSVLGTDLSWPMLKAATARVRGARLSGRLQFALASMEHIPAQDQCFDFVVAHGIWNLAPSGATFRSAVAEAARVARPGAPLFVFTFSRHTLPPAADPVPGDPFVFTQFSGQPQCFLTQSELIVELAAAGFDLEPSVPIQEYNRSSAAGLTRASVPVIYEAVFRKRP